MDRANGPTGRQTARSPNDPLASINTATIIADLPRHAEMTDEKTYRLLLPSPPRSLEHWLAEVLDR